jgi:CHAD domain-containing protein
MSYRLKINETLPAGICRIAREQLEDALGEIVGFATGEEDAAVHATRKDIKKIRAVLRLVRKEIGAEIFKEENRRLREVARSFSGARDARVQLQVLEKLLERAGQEPATFPKTAAALKDEIAAVSDSFGTQRREAETTLQRIGDRLEGWPLEDLCIDDLCRALQRSYQRGRNCFWSVSEDPRPENFHSWRRRVKDLWYQLRILQNLNPAVMCEITQAAKTLGEQLGELHDLAFFRAGLEAAQHGDEGERKGLLGLVCSRERELERIALDLGARFYAEKPGAFGRRLLRYARAWRAQRGPA